ncbi:hypothetical protein SeMB42_g07482 [Synchytrium endobioticum]|uniref:CCR4-NOT transcription complex subunit 11 n=1 Tax=Synchytrium endobioticum TaxID=286115 RepID=A0A507C2Z7_9FUNG|nr:hypothetical protein SeMB42_g07482 [Synchytrium endobioticum]
MTGGHPPHSTANGISNSSNALPSPLLSLVSASSTRNDQKETTPMPITPRDIETLYTAFTNGIDSQMVAVAGSLQRALLPHGALAGEHPGVSHRFSICAALAVLLKERVLLPLPTLRIQALFLLWYFYRTNPVNQHPFLKTFLEYADSSSGSISNSPSQPQLSGNLAISWCERWVVRSILFEECTPLALLRPNYTSLLAALHDIVDARGCKENEAPGFKLITEEEGDRSRREPTVVEALTAAKQLFEAVGAGNHCALLGFAPTLDVRPPDMLPFANEAIWLEPAIPVHQIEWDYSLGVDLQERDEARKLISLAQSTPLTLAQLQKILRQLERHPKLVYDCGLSPDKLSDLIENNHIVASEVLVRLIESSSINDRYLQALLNVNVSLRSMEVVNRLATASSSNLPKEFIYLFISTCIQNCGNVKDKYVQYRQVRLVCVFLQSLIRNRILVVGSSSNNNSISEDNSVEIQTFCVQFSRVREAAALYKLLKESRDLVRKLSAWNYMLCIRAK